MTDTTPDDERALAGAVREHHNNPTRSHTAIRQKDRDRTDIARTLNARGVNWDDIAAVCGIQRRQVPAVLRGERV